MGSKAPVTKPESEIIDRRASVNDVCEDIETMRGVVEFLVDVSCTGLFSREGGIGLSEHGEIGLTFILRSVAGELDKISRCCAANLQPKASN